jgi:DNA-binding transcriptional MerR regulator
MLRRMDDGTRPPELLSIGRFARLTGTSIGALRHYHEVGLLEPARIDPESGYRSYHPDQADAARLIRSLRDLDLGLPAIRAVLAADPDGRRTLLRTHRDRLVALQARTVRQLHWLTRTIDHEETPMTASTAGPIDVADRRQLAVDLFNRVWALLETPDRTAAQVDEMIHAAHASRYHWGEVGAPENLARGEWQCSRVYSVLGRAEPALWHARRSLAMCEEHGIGDWDVAFAWEAIARAQRVAGDHASADASVARARELGAAIADAEDRELLEGDLATIERAS